MISKVSTLIGATLYMLILGTYYILGSISPYIASYFNVSEQQVLTLLPTIIFM